MLTAYIRCCIVIYMRRRKEMKRLVSYRFEEELIKRLDQLSKRTYIPKSKLVELALDEIITKKGDEVNGNTIRYHRRHTSHAYCSRHNRPCDTHRHLYGHNHRWRINRPTVGS